MADDRTKTGGADRTQINRNEAYEVDYWTKELGVSRERLLAAIDKVGPRVAEVRHELGAR
ncbi:MAG TPA: DUF3606 domain-containing protein [Rhizomicrobium sp.]|jgi:hypothetical protein